MAKAGAVYSGKQLAADMLVSGMTTAAVAELVGKSPRAVQLWLSGELPVPVAVRRMVRAVALGLVSRGVLERL